MIAALLLFAACPHPYMPLTSGGTWTYRLADGAEVTLAVEAVDTGDGWQAAQVGSWVTEDATAPVARTSFTCGDEGVVAPVGAAALAGRARVEVLRERGVSLPPRPAKGASWESSRVLRVTADGRSATTAIASTHRIVREEKVRTPAGTFDAMRVEVTTAVSRDAAAKPETHRTVLWYARDAGLVKMEGEAELVLVRRGKR